MTQKTAAEMHDQNIEISKALKAWSEKIGLKKWCIERAVEVAIASGSFSETTPPVIFQGDMNTESKITAAGAYTVEQLPNAEIIPIAVVIAKQLTEYFHTFLTKE